MVHSPFRCIQRIEDPACSRQSAIYNHNRIHGKKKEIIMKKVKKMYKINEKFLQYTDIPCPPTVTGRFSEGLSV
ncbi:hypothetical protein DW260_00670 [Clostridium sp. AM22-16AC]|jgi:hypothetical protein|nr:hypothetical protein DW260_00670 [Clostridium sp. AM22-16AC]RHS67207.1 hypothetical protein DW954_05540 [Clostridium sp. AM45-5]